MTGKQVAAWISVAFGLVGVFAPGLLEHIWIALGYASADRLVLGVATALVFFVAVPMLVMQLDLTELQDRLATVPPFTVLTQDSGMEDASKAFMGATAVLNTRLIEGDAERFNTTPAGKIWNSRLLSSVKDGTRFREIVSLNCKQTAIERRNRLINASGKYDVRVSEHTGSFINFVIVVRDEQKTVWFGWLVSHGTTDNVVFKTDNPKLVSMFEQFFNERFLGAKDFTQ